VTWANVSCIPAHRKGTSSSPNMLNHWPPARNPRSPTSRRQHCPIPPRNFAGSGSGKPVEVRTKALVSETRSAQVPVQSPSRESRLTGGQQADRRPRAPRPLAVGSQAQQLPPVKLAVQAPSLVQLRAVPPGPGDMEAVIPAAIAYLLPHIASTGCSTNKERKISPDMSLPV
jgi:hypothetical protein